MRTSLDLIGRIVVTVLVLVWWSIGLTFLYTGPPALIYIVPLEIVGAVMAWKIADPGRHWD